MTSLGRSPVDEAAFNTLFEAHYSSLRRFVLRRIENREALEDILSEVFAVIWRRRAEIPDPPLPFLFGVCKLVISNHNRSVRRRLRLRGRFGATRAETARDPAEIYEERDEIRRAFARLSTDQREVLSLVAWDGLSTADAAEVVGCTAAAFRVRCHRARLELSKHLPVHGHEAFALSLPANPHPAQETR